MNRVHALAAPRRFGDHLRQWRQRRRCSQLELSALADISTRHLSFVEAGRSMPSREVVLRLSERLDIPLRERNTMLIAAGDAPMYRERALDDRSARRRTRCGRPGAREPRTEPGACGGPALEHGGAQPHRADAVVGSRPGHARAAGQRAAPEPAPAGPGLQELAVETLFAADECTAEMLRSLG